MRVKSLLASDALEPWFAQTFVLEKVDLRIPGIAADLRAAAFTLASEREGASFLLKVRARADAR
ncbi:MAG TPA: hypothetical protein VIH60_01395 [Steroidobacteraceae bacterium]